MSTKSPTLAGKIAVVTGGGRGIGEAICRRFAQEGATVIVADIDLENASAVAKSLGGESMAVALNVASLDSIEGMVAEVLQKRGPIDILVNNAGIFHMASVIEIKPEDFERVFAVNVRGVLFTLQAVTRQMIELKRPGKVINIASEAGRRGEAFIAVYCAAKAAVISITQSTGLELIKQGIHVNAISPGVVDTPMWKEVDALFAKYEGREIGEKKRLVGAAVPYGRMGKPEDHAGAAVFLASSDSDYMVGQTMNVDGGNCLN